MKILLHPGDHGPDLGPLIAQAWEQEDCLVFCPPRVRDFRTLASLPPGEIDWRGEWVVRPEVPQGRASEFPEKPLFGVFTTGTSGGEPRLVYYSRRNVEASLAAVFSLFDVTRVRALFCYPQASHTFGLVLGYLAAQRFGWKLIAAAGKYSSTAHAARAVVSEPGLITLGTPAHFRDLKAYCDREGIRLAPSYSAIVGGGPVTRELWRMLRDDLNIEAPSIGYGATEASPGVSHLPPGLEPRADGEIGFPLPHLQIRLASDGIGFRGPSLALAIARGQTLEFPEEGFLADRVVVGADGRWHFDGRCDAVLNRGGEKFALDLLEKELSALTGREVLAVAVPHERLGQELGVLVRGPLQAEWLSQAPERLEQRCGCRFAGLRWREVEAFPLGANGKPDRAAASSLIVDKSFPVPVAELAETVPHRAPMVWIDDVLKATEDGGTCRLQYRPDAYYSGANGPRPSSFAEFLAQGYGFVQACARRGAGKPKDAFLAAMTKIEIADHSAVAPGEWLTIEVKRVREMGPVALVDGKVLTSDGRTLASGQLKLFAQ